MSVSKGMKQMPWTLAGVWHLFLPFEAELFMNFESESLIATFSKLNWEIEYLPWTLAGVWHLFLPFEAELFMDSWEWITHCHLSQIKSRDWVLAMNMSASNSMKQMPWTLAGVWHLFLPFEAELFMDS